jgi:hypothetical protein
LKPIEEAAYVVLLLTENPNAATMQANNIRAGQLV